MRDVRGVGFWEKKGGRGKADGRGKSRRERF